MRPGPTSGRSPTPPTVRQALLNAGWADDHIRVLTDGGATAAAIRGGLQWLVDHSGPTSLSVFHYSGHVKQVGSTEYLWPHDNSFIADTELAGEHPPAQGPGLGRHLRVRGGRLRRGDLRAQPAVHRLVPGQREVLRDARQRQSVFTLLQIEQAMLKGQGDANRDGRVSVQEAFAYAAQRAPQITAGSPRAPSTR